MNILYCHHDYHFIIITVINIVCPRGRQRYMRHDHCHCYHHFIIIIVKALSIIFTNYYIILFHNHYCQGSKYHFHKLLYHRSALRSQRRSRKRNSLLTLTLLLVLLWVSKQPFNLDQSFG